MEERAKREARRVEQQTKRAASEISDNAKQAIEKAHVEATDRSASASEKLRAGRQNLRRDAGRAQTAFNEASVTAQVKSKLASEVGFHPATEIAVHTTGSVVTLEGEVESADQKQAAERVAASVSGVTRVVNHLRVKAE